MVLHLYCGIWVATLVIIAEATDAWTHNELVAALFYLFASTFALLVVLSFWSGATILNCGPYPYRNQHPVCFWVGVFLSVFAALMALFTAVRFTLSV
jgi:hypothetical protein